jgi:beta-glucosidase
LAAAGAQEVPDAKALRAGDVAIYVFGESPYAEFEGDKDSTDFDRLSKADIAFFKAMQAKGVKTVAVFLTGRPSGIDKIIDLSDAFVVAWLPGSEGAGIADVLVADNNGQARYDFTGKLPFAWPADDAAAIGTRYKLGFGLSY